MSVLENVLVARPNQKRERLLSALVGLGVVAEEVRNHEEAKRWLGFVGLDSAANKLAGELSYGEQKLLTLACCLATEARILLVDEPVAGVHPDMVCEICSLLRQVRNVGKHVIVVEHDIAFVRQVADDVIVMDEGRIIAHGVPSEVLERAEIIDAYVG